MQIKDLLVNISVVVSCSSATIFAVQDDYQIPDLAPSQVQLQRPAEDKPTAAAPMSVQPSMPKPTQNTTTNPAAANQVMENGLRGSLDNPPTASAPTLPPAVSQPTFDAAPIPPQRPAVRGTSDVASPVDPLRQLDPSRLIPPTADPRTAPTAPPPALPAASPATNHGQPTGPISTSRHRNLPAGAPMAVETRIPDTLSDQPAAIAKASFDERRVTGNQNQVQQLLQPYDVSSVQGPLPGRPVSLDELLRSTPIPARLNMLRQYWDTYFDWATLQNRRSWANWLGQLPRARTDPQQLILQTARSMAADELLAAEIQLAESQSKLHQLAVRRDDLLPLPLNEPLTGNYITHYDWYASRQIMPAKLKGINEMLPRNQTLISQRANTVQQAVSARNQASQAFASGQIGVADLLQAGQNWQTSLQGFVGSVVSYNQAISDYALNLTSPQKPVDQILTMLVPKSKPVTEVAQANSIMERPRSSTDLNRSGIRTTDPASATAGGGNRAGFPSQPPIRSGPNRAPTANSRSILPPQNFQAPTNGPTASTGKPANRTFPPTTGQPTSRPPQSQPASGAPQSIQPGSTSGQFNGGGSFGG